MKKLFLASSFKDVANIFADFEKDLKGKTVTFIPTASKVEKVVFYVNSGKKALQKLGLIIDELDISTASNDEINSKLRNNDFIYITGGNTFFLLQELKKTGADKIIIDEINKGKLYIGESAGAIVTSANVEYAKRMDDVKKAPNLTEFSGLNLVDFYVIPHYTNFPFEKTVEKIIEDYSSKLNLSPISNKDAILVVDNKIDFIQSKVEK
ncbi:Type 1 glutamine amidotransferase-like domain-containing protein [Aliarcobacter butzleri]|uniref:peptidase E n=1 Tax=Aliarcobacter butzleri TaxID=28197 RepID=UPI001EDA0481|nr:Type 1 glutamine amidotransferase-like domain-containing protein [Aliarcobacter butzleri]MCG3664159.1 Type 1 glutamine amidotransferase-like domain-containing protein [Aliarcobacter butzleri]MCG3700855.1 Type 1 glutamine amidotransferase-like domain-containing protein [Aliarcobacter butzleri]MDS1314405.1 Type 1 glutamine amidotransferase-like domain-containing protein [Aliarcobacter butzleri]